MSALATADKGVVPDFFANLGIVERPVEKNDQFQILGDFCQIVHMKLESQQSIQVEPGVMCYMVSQLALLDISRTLLVLIFCCCCTC